MAFDGVPHGGPAMIDPFDHHPAAPMSGRVLSNALQTAYYGARNHSRGILQQTYGYNGQDDSANFDTGFLVLQTGYVRIAEVHCFIPAEVNTIQAQILYSALPHQDATSYHRSVAVDAVTPTPNTATGSPHTQAVAAGSWVFGIGGGGSGWHVARAHQGARPYSALVECDVSSLTAGAVWSVRLEGYVAGTAAATYRPQYAAAWWQVRG